MITCLPLPSFSCSDISVLDQKCGNNPLSSHPFLYLHDPENEGEKAVSWGASGSEVQTSWGCFGEEEEVEPEETGGQIKCTNDLQRQCGWWGSVAGQCGS